MMEQYLMQRMREDVHLVVTVALKAEIPQELMRSPAVPVYSLRSLKAGCPGPSARSQAGMIVVLTGPGAGASEEAALWVRDSLNPLFVMNIGTCGMLGRNYPLGKWIAPDYVANEKGEEFSIDRRRPLRYPEGVIEVTSLLSVQKAKTGGVPPSWKRYDAVDMECCAQAKVFSGTRTSFHCLKFSTDYSDRDTASDFQKHVRTFRERITEVICADRAPCSGNDITVVIPVHNREHTIERAIDSVLSQSCRPEEIIVVDDGSTDRTREILKRYGDGISSISLPVRSGPSGARNRGIENARTGWVAFLDSDDRWRRDKLQRQVEYLRRYPFYEILQTDETWIRNGVRVNPCRHHKKFAGWIWEASLERCLISPSAVLVKKALLELYGKFDEDLPACEDYALWLKISRRHPVGFEPAPAVIKYGGHKDQLSRSVQALDRFRVRALCSILDEERSPRRRQKILSVIGKKLSILINGYEKRMNTEKAEEYREMMRGLMRGQEGSGRARDII